MLRPRPRFALRSLLLLTLLASALLAWRRANHWTPERDWLARWWAGAARETFFVQVGQAIVIPAKDYTRVAIRNARVCDMPPVQHSSRAVQIIGVEPGVGVVSISLKGQPHPDIYRVEVLP